MKDVLILALLGSCVCGQALAQVQTEDTDRLSVENGIANCMAKARASSEATVSPARNIKGSYATPGSAGQSAAVGSTGVAGQAPSGTTVGGLDLGNIMGTPGTLSSLQVGNFGQAVSAVSAVANALQTNTQTLQGLGATIGTANGTQAGFDQNTGIRVGAAAVWNQAVQVGNTALSLQTQRLDNKTASAALASQIMKADGPASVPASGSASSVPATTDPEVLKALQALQSGQALPSQ